MTRSGGFTFIEILIAMGIFALFLVPLLQNQMLAGQAVIHMQQRREALAIATAHLDAAQRDSTPGDSVSTDQGYQVSVSSTHMTGAILPLTRIQVVVSYANQPVASVAAYRM